MRLLVTGGMGFIGSAVVRLAIERGHHVINVDCLSYAGCSKNVAKVANDSKYKFEECDIRIKKNLDDIFIKHSPDGVIHLAAETHVDRSIDDPSEFITTNVNGTYNMLETMRCYWKAKGCCNSYRFVHVSTDEVYGSLSNDDNIKFLENTPYNPRSPYSASKASSDHLVRAWHNTYGLPVLITNCSNNYGPYQFPEKLIPVIILNALAEKKIPIYGSGENVRDWLFVEDHAKALLLVLEKGSVGRSYNIGSENECTNLELVKKICRILDKLHPRNKGLYSDLITFVNDRPGHDERYAIDPNRIYQELGWRPSVTLEDGLIKTVKWYIENQDWWKPLLNRSIPAQSVGTKI